MSISKPIPKGEEITGAITKHMDRRFLSSIDLIGMGEVELTIARVEKHESLVYANGNKDANAILIYFTETEKPLKLCATNIKSIIMRIGSSKVKDWHGKKIKLKVEKVQAFGKLQDAVRVQ
jgi:hypothetical protein